MFVNNINTLTKVGPLIPIFVTSFQVLLTSFTHLKVIHGFTIRDICCESVVD